MLTTRKVFAFGSLDGVGSGTADLGAEDERQHVPGRGERAEEGARSCRHRRLRQEPQKAVQAEHDDNQPEQDPGGDRTQSRLTVNSS